MTTESMATPHHGRNVKRIREMLGIKQEALAIDLGISQQAISALEQKEAFDKELLEKVAKALNVNPEAIKNATEESAINYFNTFNDNSGRGAFFSSTNNNCTFNPVEELMKSIQEIKLLHEENRKLYERLLQSEREKVALFEKLLEGKK
jgi:transcriptional regulator with XRE-family HTH domain